MQQFDDYIPQRLFDNFQVLNDFRHQNWILVPFRRLDPLIVSVLNWLFFFIFNLSMFDIPVAS